MTSLLSNGSATVRYATLASNRRRDVVTHVLERDFRGAARDNQPIAQRVRSDRLGHLGAAREDVLTRSTLLASSLAPSCKLALEGLPH